MDRNKQKLYIWIVLFNVATREGGVDRNKDLTETTAAQLAVATREGGVDRNRGFCRSKCGCLRSPPARVAWIETSSCLYGKRLLSVSPPARVAWIETLIACSISFSVIVATREGGVDRNHWS